MPKLQHHRGSLRVHRFYDFAPARDLLPVFDTRRTEPSIALTRHESGLSDQKAASSGSLLVVGGHRRPRHVARHLRPHAGKRGQHYAVSEIEGTHAYGCEQLGHKDLPSYSTWAAHGSSFNWDRLHGVSEDHRAALRRFHSSGDRVGNSMTSFVLT